MLGGSVKTGGEGTLQTARAGPKPHSKRPRRDTSPLPHPRLASSGGPRAQVCPSYSGAPDRGRLLGGVTS